MLSEVLLPVDRPLEDMPEEFRFDDFEVKLLYSRCNAELSLVSRRGSRREFQTGSYVES